MNIFVLHQDPMIAAQEMCDKHVVKMILETAQLLCSPFPEGVAPYKRTHYNHPSAIWVRENTANYWWLLRHGTHLTDEYTFRYNKFHKSSSVLNWCYEMFHTLPAIGIPRAGNTSPFPQCMPEQYKIPNDPVQAYKNYYIGEKKKFAKWNKGREAPGWFV